MDSVQQISNDIAHDLKRPLTKLRDQLGLALDRAKNGLDVEESLLRAQDQARNIQSLFEAMLRIAQIESGARRARFRPVRLDAVLQDLYSTFGPVAKQSGQTLVLKAPSTKAEIHGDEELLTQLFVNLIENCMVHNASGVTITLSLTALAETIVATVSDDGQGIPAAEHGLVTQRFYRCDKSRSTGGSGLGLSLVAAVVSLHDATLAFADNHPGLNTTIVFPIGPRTARQ
jgi:signal transduction histidine kinase